MMKTTTDTQKYEKLMVSVRTPMERALVESLIALSRRLDTLEARTGDGHSG